MFVKRIETGITGA